MVIWLRFYRLNIELSILRRAVKAKPIANIDFIFTKDRSLLLFFNFSSCLSIFSFDFYPLIRHLPFSFPISCSVFQPPPLISCTSLFCIPVPMLNLRPVKLYKLIWKQLEDSPTTFRDGNFVFFWNKSTMMTFCNNEQKWNSHLFYFSKW